MTAHPAAYLRRSYVDPDSPGDISREAQRATVRRLASKDGHNGNLIEYDDWGISADIAKAGKRTAYTRLLGDMEAGKVAAVYAFDVDRLYRDPRDLIRLQDAAQRHRVKIVTTSGELAIGDGDDPAAEGFAFMGAVFGRMELQKAKKRNRAARDARMARGDAMGRPPYGYQHGRDATGRVTFVPNPRQPLAPVLEAFREVGSFAGAARLLNRRNVPTARGQRWAGNVVNRIIRREAPGLVPRGRVVERVAVRGSHLFSRLLRCSCGRLMTPRVGYTTTKYGSYGPYIGYQCYAGRHDPAHPRPYMVSEPLILEWAMVEAARFAPSGKVKRGTDDATRAALEAEREQLGDKLLARVWSAERIAARADAIDEALASLEAAHEAVQIPERIDWEKWDAASINAILRTYWQHVELDEQMQPVRAEWRIPAEYVR